MHRTTNQTPFAELANLDGGDYTLSVDIGLDRQDDRRDRRWPLGTGSPRASHWQLCDRRRAP